MQDQEFDGTDELFLVDEELIEECLIGSMKCTAFLSILNTLTCFWVQSSLTGSDEVLVVLALKSCSDLVLKIHVNVVGISHFHVVLMLETSMSRSKFKHFSNVKGFIRRALLSGVFLVDVSLKNGRSYRDMIDDGYMIVVLY
jgi:hypothetical protein